MVNKMSVWRQKRSLEVAKSVRAQCIVRHYYWQLIDY